MMPLRVIRYDGAEYRSQYDSKEPKDLVVTFVLYFGTNPRWEDEMSLRDCLEISGELEEYVNDYVLNPQTIDHVKETLELLSVMGDDCRFDLSMHIMKEKTRAWKEKIYGSK